jgi:hypothetical protein
VTISVAKRTVGSVQGAGAMVRFRSSPEQVRLDRWPVSLLVALAEGTAGAGRSCWPVAA